MKNGRKKNGIEYGGLRHVPLKRDNSYCPDTFERDGHIIATANGYHVTDCPGCNKREVNEKFTAITLVIVVVFYILFKYFCGCP